MSEAKHKWPSFGLVKHLQESIFAILCLLGRSGQTPLLSANSIQIQQEAIHRKRFTVLTNSKGFSLQLIGIWPKPYPIWPSSQLCQVFRGPPLPTCRQQRENSFRTLRMCICLRLYSYLVHTHTCWHWSSSWSSSRTMAPSVKIHFADGSHVTGCPTDHPANTSLHMFYTRPGIIRVAVLSSLPMSPISKLNGFALNLFQLHLSCASLVRSISAHKKIGVDAKKT